MRICIYPGTFDPVTNGHLDLIKRGLTLFDQMIIAVSEDNYKANLFNQAQRVEIMKEVTKGFPRLEVEGFSGLLMDFCAEKGAVAVIRGLRAVSDFEYEMQMALMNNKLNPDVEMVYLMTGQKYSFISSSIIKNVAQLGGDIHDLVPAIANEKIIEKYRRQQNGRL